jgi:replication factor A1
MPKKGGSHIKIRDLRGGMDGVAVEGWIAEVGEKREVVTRFGKTYVMVAVLEDETGRIILNLWRDQINIAKPNCLVRIEGGFVREYSGRLELNVGSRGKVVVL